METEALIKAMAADAGQRRPGFGLRWAVAVGLAVVLAGGVFAALLSPRADLGLAMAQPRFLAKLVVVVVLALSLLPALRGAARPVPQPLRGLWVAPVALALAVVAEAFALPSGSGWAAMMGQHNGACLGLVTLIGLGPLAVFLGFLRAGAPGGLTRAGALGGLASGGIAASFYALHCTDDSPYFVAVWYGLAIVGLGLLGAVLAPRVARW